MIRQCEALRAPEVLIWQHTFRVKKDATGRRNGGAERTVWEVLLDKERFTHQAGEKEQGAIALCLFWQDPFGRSACQCATHFIFLRKVLRVPCGYFEHQRRAKLEGCLAEPLQTIRAILPRSRRIVLQDALSEATQVYPPLKLAVFLGEMWSLVDVAEKILKKIKKEVEEKGPRLSITEGGNQGKEQGNHLVQVSGGEVQGMQQKRGSCGRQECRNLESGLENESQAAGREGEGKKKCEVGFSLIERNRVFQKNYVRRVVWKFLRTGWFLRGHEVSIASTLQKG